MKTRAARPTETGPKLPPPPSQQEDVVNDLGWLSRGPARRANRAADRNLAPLLLEDDEPRSEEHTSELQSRVDIVCCLLLEKKKSQSRCRLNICIRFLSHLQFLISIS